MKISIVTPARNSSRFIEETILSVITQEGDFSIEYIIMDGLSTDGTKEIIENYVKKLDTNQFNLKCIDCKIHFVSEKDSGMYDAINKGFSKATGDVYAWINSDDVYLPGAFSIITNAFNTFPEIQWVKGITNYINEDSSFLKSGKCWLYDRKWIGEGLYGRELQFIQQDSVFWRSELWKKSHGLNPTYRLAGDYDLWIKFSEFSDLVSVNIPVSCFRQVKGQLSSNMEGYRKEMTSISKPDESFTFKLKIYRKMKKFLPESFCLLIKCILFGSKSFSVIESDQFGLQISIKRAI